MAYISFFIALFLVVSRLVNRRMIINGYTPLQAGAIIVFSLPLSFFLLKQQTNVCYDSITFAMGSINLLCEVQGLMVVFGYHSVVLCLVARVVSVFLIVVYRRNVPRVYLTFVTLVLSAVFCGLCSSHIRFNGGSICGPAHLVMRRYVHFPILAYSSIGLLLQFATSIYVTVTIVQVRLSILRSRIPDDPQNGRPGKISFASKVKISIASHGRALRLLWRTYVTSLFLGGVIVFAALQYIISTRGNSGNNRLGTQEWIVCVIRASYEDGYDGDVSSCRKYLQGQGTYTRTLLGMILVLAFAIIFLFTELRMFLFQSWYQLIRAGPKVFISKKRSDAILDTIADDQLSKVWLPERLQNRFFGGSWNPPRPEDNTTDSDLEYQLDVFVQRKAAQAARASETSMMSDSYSNITGNTRVVESTVNPKLSPPVKVKTASKFRTRFLPQHGRQQQYKLPKVTKSTVTTRPPQKRQLNSAPMPQSNWIKSFVTTTEQRHKQKQHQVQGLLQSPRSKPASVYSATKRRLSSTLSLANLSSLSLNYHGGSRCTCRGDHCQGAHDRRGSSSSSSTNSSSQRSDEARLNDIEEDELEMDFMSFLKSSRPPPWR